MNQDLKEFAAMEQQEWAFRKLLLESHNLPFYARLIGCTSESLKYALENISDGSGVSPEDSVPAANTHSDMMLRIGVLYTSSKDADGELLAEFLSPADLKTVAGFAA
jgi:hypothetical protein